MKQAHCQIVCGIAARTWLCEFASASVGYAKALSFDCETTESSSRDSARGAPFFEELFEKWDPDIEIARALHNRGYVIIDFPDTEIVQVADRITASLSDYFRIEGGARIQDAWSFNDEVRRLACNENIVALLGKLYGRKALPFQTLNFPFGSEQHFHSDAIHFSSLPERFMCGVWIALEDVGEEQGPLVYYPGSNRWPIYKSEHIGHIYRPGLPPKQETYEPYGSDWSKHISCPPNTFCLVRVRP